MPDDPSDPSVLGNLPRSRPGRRSAKRSTAQSASSTSKPAAAGSRAKGKRPASKPRASSRPASGQRRPAAAGRPQPTDPVTGAIRLAGQVAGAGLKVAGEVIKRLPGR